MNVDFSHRVIYNCRSFIKLAENLEVNIKLKFLKKSNRRGGRGLKFLAKWERGAFACYLSISASQLYHNLLNYILPFSATS